MKYISILSLLLTLLACNQEDHSNRSSSAYPEVQMASAMRNVMWEGKLGPAIQLDTISERKGLYGLGPLTYLRGELLIKEGKTFVSRVSSDTSMSVEIAEGLAAPFFVYAHVQNWQSLALPDSIRDIPSLEAFIDQQSQHRLRPFAFKLSGTIQEATIHIQNLPEGSTVSSPKEAHRGQTNYQLRDEAVDIIGFFSTEHQAVFTHHDSFVHLHLISQDERQMGHLDEVRFVAKEMQLFFPVN